MGLINIVRDITRLVKVFPFFYALLLLICWAIYLFVSYEAYEFIDNLIFFSAVAVGLLIRMSYILKFCFWHRLQCVLPLIPQAINIVDTYIYEFAENVMLINISTAFTIFILSIVNTYFVFIKPSIRR